MGNIKRLFIYLCCILYTFAINGQGINFKQLNTKENLSHYSAMALYQDHRGLLWIGTRNGISVYDGHEIEVYRHDKNGVNTMAGNYIRDIVGDNMDNIYFHTIRGVSQYQISDDSFTQLTNEDAGAIFCHQNHLYIALGNTIRIFKEKENIRVCRILQEHIKISSLFIHNDSVYIGTEEHGLYITNTDFQILSHPITEEHITRIFRDSQGQFWIGTWDKGAYLLTEENHVIKNFHHIPNNPNSLCSNFIRTFCEDMQGNIWIGTFRGLSKYNQQTGNFTSFKAQSNKKGELSHSSIWSLLCDRQGNIWVGTYFGGINHFSPTKNIISYQLSDENLLYEPIVGAMTEDDKGNLWICTEGDGLCKYNRQTKDTKWFKHHENRNSISANNLKSIYYDSKRNVLWIGTHLGGLNKLDLKTLQFKHYSCKNEASKIHKSDIVCDIVSYKEQLLLATHDGVYSFDIKEEKFIPMFKQSETEVTIDFALDLHIDKKERLWIAGSNKGVFVYDLKHRTISSYTTDSGLSTNGVNCLFEDSERNMYFCTAEQGIDLLLMKDSTFHHFNEMTHNLPSNCIYGACETAPGRIVFTTDKGFSFFNFKQKEFRHFNIGSQIPLTGINQNAIYQTASNEIFIGGIDGMISFNPKDLDTHEKPYRIFPYKLFINDQEIKANDKSGILKQSLSSSPIIQLKHDQSMISLLYAITDYASLSRNDIIYRLENFSENWTNLRNGRMITYTNLAPGNYTLIVKSANDKNADESRIQIIVLPPWYKSTIAYIIYTLCTLLIITIIFRSYSNRLKLQAALEYERKHIQDIENLNQHKLRFFTNISHEFRTPLTLIAGNIKLLLQVKTFVPAIYNRLLSTYKSTLQLQSLIDELLDFRKQEQGHMKIKVREHNIVDFLNENYLLFKEYAQSKNIQFSFTTNDECIHLWYDAKQMQKVINNLISNAFQYTPQGKEVKLSIEKREKEVHITVSDTGQGIPEKDIERIFNRFYQTEETILSPGKGIGIGLALTKGIVELHHGTLSVNSKLQEGSTFTIILPIGKKHFKVEEIAEELSINQTGNMLQTKTEQELVLIEESQTTEKTIEKQRHSILIAEDDESIRQMLADIFSTYYQVTTVSNGEDAWSKIIQKEQPDIIVSDVLMPGITGIELCKRIKNNLDTCHIPIILLTARTAFEYKMEGWKIGADDYIIKPFDINILLARCNNLINNRILLQEKFSKQPSSTVQEFATNPLDKEFMDKAILVIEENLDNIDFNVNDFASEMCIARTKLFTKLKGITGKTPNEFILNIRLKKAAQLLRRNPELNITAISEQVGFNSPRYFSRCFRETFNMTPLAYRQQEN